MSARLKKNFDFLRVLRRANNKQKKALISNANKDLVLCICEIVDNILAGTVRLTPKQKKQLVRYKRTLRQLIDKKVSVDQKKKIIANQTGGFLPAILGPILGIAASLLADQLIK